MGYAERRGDYWRGRYKLANGKYGTVSDTQGTIRFRTKREAEQAADDAEATVRAGRHRNPTAGRMTFGEYANRWYAAQNLAASTMENYRLHLENHLLPVFGNVAVADILPSDLDAWEKKERAAGYADASVKTWRGTLHLVLADAVSDGLRDFNPAAKRRGRGKRTGRSQTRAPEKVVTDALGILLVAERAALLAGRHDEFVGIVLLGFTGMRWGELVGLETAYVRPASVRVEWQLYELDSGQFIRCPPKEDSYRTIDLPTWLARLLSGHLAIRKPAPCVCHGRTYVFRGHGPTSGVSRTPGGRIGDVARRAGVSVGTVSAVLNRPASVPEATRNRVELAVAELGYVPGGVTGKPAEHWRRNGFATWVFQPATTGRYPRKAPHEARPVPLLGEPWPGVPVRGRNAPGRADACWLPIAPGLTPHGLRHTHRTLMAELGVPAKLMDDRMGHSDGSVQARYSHVTAPMRQALLDDLSRVWDAALAARRTISSASPVATLDALLKRSAS